MEYMKVLLLSTLLLGLLTTVLGKPSNTTSYEYEDYNNDKGYFEDGGGSDYDYPVNDNNEVNNNVHQDKAHQKAPIIKSSPINIRGVAGQSVLLPCDIQKEGSILLWYNGSDTNLLSQSVMVLKNSDRIKIYSNLSIEISNLSSYDSQKYYWISIPDNIKQEYNLEVFTINHMKNPLRIISENMDYTGKNLILKENDSTEFECKWFENNQEKPTLKWSYIKSNRSEQAENHVSRIIDGKIIIDRIDYHHSGDYCCLGDYKNRNSNLPMACINLIVNYSPKLSTHRHHINTKIGGTAELYCDHKAQPEPTIKWLKIYTDEITKQKRAKQILPDNYKFEIKNELHKEHGKNNVKSEIKSRTYLIINDITQSDLVKYECQGTNEFGSDVVEITVTNRPEKPVFEDIDIEGNKVTIHWLDRSIETLTEASIQFKLDDHTKWMTQQVFETKKHPEHQHHWKIRHQDTLGKGKWVVQVRVKNVNGWSGYSAPYEFDIPENDGENVIADEVVQAGFGPGSSRTNNSENDATSILLSTSIIGLCILINFMSSRRLLT